MFPDNAPHEFQPHFRRHPRADRSVGLAQTLVQHRWSSDRSSWPARVVAEVAISQCSSLWTLLMTEWYLVWVDGLRGPEPQKWSSDALWGQLGRQDIIVRFPLTDQEAKLSLDQLAKLHPVPRE